jgi:hypothetical protein
MCTFLLCRDPSKEEHPRSDTDTATIVSEIESALSQVAKTGFSVGGGGGLIKSTIGYLFTGFSEGTIL